MRHFIFFFLGLFTGFLASFLGIGGGIVFMPVFLFLLKIPFRQAASLSLGAIIPMSLAGILGHFFWGMGVPPWMVLGQLLAGAFFGIGIGLFLRKRLPPMVVGVLFLLFVLFMGAQLLGFHVLNQITNDANTLFVLALGFFCGIIASLLGLG